MPVKNSIKVYVRDSFYHVYNRGVEKRTIYEDTQDYKVFLNYLKQQLSSPPDRKKLRKKLTFKGVSFKGVPRQPKNFHGEIDMIAYCLMPNHFHFLIKQKSQNTIEKFMRSLFTRYSMYFNQRYDRVGSLFQGTYKAVLIKDDTYLLHLSRYIHQNPFEHTNDLINIYSSYADYLGKRNTEWVKPQIILSFFNQSKLPFLEKTNSYKDFVEGFKQDSGKILGELILENDL